MKISSTYRLTPEATRQIREIATAESRTQASVVEQAIALYSRRRELIGGIIEAVRTGDVSRLREIIGRLS
jgi:predicted transcriptional regulator